MESKIKITKVSKPKKQAKDKTDKEPEPEPKQKPKKQKQLSGLKSKGQDTLVKESTYSHNLHVKRIEKLVKIAKDRIKIEIEETQKRTPSKNEVDKIYKDRLNEYEKTMKSVAVGGPASLL